MLGIYFGLLALGAALAVPIAAIGAGIGEGMIFSAAISSIARQPEAEGRIFIILLGKLPGGSATVQQMLAGH